MANAFYDSVYYVLKYYQENKEYHQEKVREWYEANRDRVHEYKLQWAREKRAEDRSNTFFIN